MRCSDWSFAEWAARLLVAQLSVYGSRVTLDTGLDWRVMVFTAAVALATALLFGIVPALRSTRVRRNEAIKEQGRSIVGESRFGFGSLLVVAQVALSLVLVVGAALFVRTFSSLAHVPARFRSGSDDDRERKRQRASSNRARIAPRFTSGCAKPSLAVPGVRRRGAPERHAADATAMGHADREPAGTVAFGKGARRPYERGQPGLVRDVRNANPCRPRFHAAGRPVRAASRARQRDVREEVLRWHQPDWPDRRQEPSPRDDTPPMQIIGLVRDAVYDSLRDADSADDVRSAVAADAPGVVCRNRRARDVRLASAPDAEHRRRDRARGSQDHAHVQSVARNRARLHGPGAGARDLSGFFGALALLLAGLGLYGVMSYAVWRRRTEIGIRMALGAGPWGAVRLVLRRAAILVSAGILVGAALSLWASRFVADLLFGLPPRDPATLTIAAVTLAVIGALAAWLPARRAARIDPAQVLRET